MRKLTSYVALALITAGAAMAQARFSDRLTPEERTAAGLDRLTPAQLAALDAIVARDHARTESVTVERPAPTPAATVAGGPPSAPVPPLDTAASADPRAAAAEPETSRRRFGLPLREDAPGITGVLDGDYRGWTGTTLFRLQDGQIWVQEDKSDRHDADLKHNPRVSITRSMFGGYKLKIEGDPQWVRVRRVQ